MTRAAATPDSDCAGPQVPPGCDTLTAFEWADASVLLTENIIAIANVAVAIRHFGAPMNTSFVSRRPEPSALLILTPMMVDSVKELNGKPTDQLAGTIWP